MKKNLSLHCPARTYETILILGVFLWIGWIVQLIIIEVEISGQYEKYQQSKTSYGYGEDEDSDPAQRRLEQIAESRKQFLLDGTFHLICMPDYETMEDLPSSWMYIYDANNNVIWEGKEGDIPFEYIKIYSQSNDYERQEILFRYMCCLLYTSDAADE